MTISLVLHVCIVGEVGKKFGNKSGSTRYGQENDKYFNDFITATVKFIPQYTIETGAHSKLVSNRFIGSHFS